jgi:GxxExxY protein
MFPVTGSSLVPTAHRKFSDLSYRIIGAAMKVHRRLGPGLLESVYSLCLAHELRKIGLRVSRNVSLAIEYDDLRIVNAFRVDQLVEDEFIVELKAVKQLTSTDVAQTKTYIRLAGWREGLLINFHVARLKDGIRHFLLPEIEGTDAGD